MSDIKILTVWNMVLLLALFGLAYHFRNSMTPAQFVYDVCNNSRVTDMYSEQTCGDVQDFYHIEFLCTDNNKLTTNQCWVEVK